MRHELWLYMWFFLGMLTYMLKRAYYLVTGPNPIANSYRQFFERCWIPLLVRAAIELGMFAACFTPGVVDKVLAYVGFTSWAAAVDMVTQFAPMAYFGGLGIDSIADFLISKIPGVRDVLPQMLGPLPAPPANPPQP